MTRFIDLIISLLVTRADEHVSRRRYLDAVLRDRSERAEMHEWVGH